MKFIQVRRNTRVVPPIPAERKIMQPAEDEVI